MLHDFARVRSFEESDDVVQNVALRLLRRLEAVQVASVAEFMRLAARETRRELIDLIRHYFGPCGPGGRQAPAAGAPSSSDYPPNVDPPEMTHQPDRLAMWAEFHERVESLPDEERAVFDLIWYEGLSQTEAAAALGVPRATVQRTWLAARLRLQAFLRDEAFD